MAKRGLFVGLATIDILYTLNDFPSENSKVVAQSQQILAGGPATNAAITFAFLGGSATLAAPVGRHTLGSLVREECRQYGVTLIDLVPDSDEIPPVSSVLVDRKGQRRVVSVNATRTTVQRFAADPVTMAEVSILLVDGHAMSAGLNWAQAAKAEGVTVVLDAGSWKPETDKLLKSVDYAICSADFIPPGCKNEDEVIQYLLASGIGNIAVTHGADPVRFVSLTSRGIVDVPAVEAVDTMGAGDIFHGAVCLFLAEGFAFEDALREAGKVASESCHYHGTRRWMETKDRETIAFPMQRS